MLSHPIFFFFFDSSILQAFSISFHIFVCMRTHTDIFLFYFVCGKGSNTKDLIYGTILMPKNTAQLDEYDDHERFQSRLCHARLTVFSSSCDIKNPI